MHPTAPIVPPIQTLPASRTSGWGAAAIFVALIFAVAVLIGALLLGVVLFFGVRSEPLSTAPAAGIPVEVPGGR